MKKYSLILIGLMISLAATAQLSPPVKSWLTAQTQIQTWSADLTETRTLQSLTVPLTSTGRIWFAAPDRFRWELGQPPQTIAVCNKTNLLIIYPRLKRVERFALTGGQIGPRSVLEMLEAGFPRSEAELLTQYQVLSQNLTNDICQLQLRPTSAAVQQMVPQIEIDIDLKNYSLRGTELEFKDGSTLRNDFYQVVLNPKLGPTIFSPTIPADYNIVEPLKK